MTIIKGFLIIFVSGLLCAAAGGALGYVLALLTPGYYRGVFHDGHNPAFDPVAVGLGLGISQGLIAGLLVGAVVVMSVAWYRSRRLALHKDLSVDPRRRPEGAEGSSEAFRPFPGGKGR
jgi:hypothetical protein